MLNKINSSAKATRYVTPASSLIPPLGMSALDHYRRTPGSSLPRVYEQIRDREEKTFPKDPDCFFTAGIAMGMAKDGLAWPYEPGKTPEFLGFLVADNGASCVVRSRGSVILPIAGLSGLDHRKPVFALAPDSFTLDADAGGTQVGAVRYGENERRAAVAFRRSGDPRPLSLDVRAT